MYQKASLSRRSLMARVFVTPALCQSMASANSADEMLARLGCKFEHLATEFDHCVANGADLTDRLFEELGRVESEILSIQATTIEGLRVKARAACWALLGDIDPAAGQTTDARMALSIVRDLIRSYDSALESPGALNKLAGIAPTTNQSSAD